MYNVATKNVLAITDVVVKGEKSMLECYKNDAEYVSDRIFLTGLNEQEKKESQKAERPINSL